jgi:hypothetical protein
LNMSDPEFDLLDELYFVQPFSYLQDALGWEDELILKTLESLYKNGLIKCLTEPDLERFDQVNIIAEGKNLYFLATKKGLMAHNAL